ncbi:MAG TPA: FAD-dependent oxidoreductase [Pseudomonadales bacterium]
MTDFKADIVIFGGGIAGLWALNRLRQLNYQAILLETDALGSGQTLLSQGMIHGGMKYALSGTLSKAANAIARMPKVWEDCLQGKGDIDLSAVKVLSRDYLMWSSGQLGSRMATFFASKLVRGRIEAVKKSALPTAFQNENFKGQAYRLNDIVLDVESLVRTLSEPYQDWIYQLDDYSFNVSSGEIATVKLGEHTLSAQCYLFAAGQGNQTLLEQAGLNTPAMQIRPLHQVFVKHKLPHKIYAHCIGTGSKPRITITSHSCSDGNSVWYLGGELAESGVERSEQQQIDFAKNELKQLFPWLDFSTAQWTTLRINRAEPAQGSGERPDHAYVNLNKNILTTWPTKLSLAPDLGQQIMAKLETGNILPAQTPTEKLPLALAKIATPFWERLF